MKYLLTVLLCWGMFCTAFAQIPKKKKNPVVYKQGGLSLGTFNIQGGFATGNLRSQFQGNLGLQAGYFIRDGLMVGVRLEGNLVTKQFRALNSELFARYYFLKKSSISPFVEGSLGYYNSRFTGPFMRDMNSVDANIRFGAEWRPRKGNLGLEWSGSLARFSSGNNPIPFQSRIGRFGINYHF